MANVEMSSCALSSLVYILQHSVLSKRQDCAGVT